jgi:hypothetical protein
MEILSCMLAGVFGALLVVFLLWLFAKGINA